MKMLVWLLSVSILSLFVRFSYAASSDHTAKITHAQQTAKLADNDTKSTADSDAAVNMTPKQLAEYMRHNNKQWDDYSGQIDFA